MLCYFYARCNGHTPSKKFNFCLVSPQSIFPKVLGIIKMFSGKTETSLFVLFAQQRFWSWNSAMQAIFAQSLSYGGVMNTDLNLNCEACSSLDVVVGSFVTSWMSRRCALGVILVGQPLLGRFTTVPCFRHLWIMALTVVR